MRLTNYSVCSALLLLLAATVGDVAGSPTGSASVSARRADSELAQLAARDSCGNGIKTCCGSASVSCSGNTCKVCCGNTCGCFYQPSNNSCSSSTPCLDPSKPDFKPTNGQCTGGGGGSTKKPTPAPAPSKNPFCQYIAPAYYKYFGC